jgi:hypothetical protein
MIKYTFTNFYREHTVLVWVLLGMVGLPLAGAALLAMIGIVLWTLTSIFGNTVGVLAFFFIVIGGIAGFIIGRILKENNDED